MLAALDHHHARPEFLNDGRGFFQIVLLGKHPGFAFVDQQNLHRRQYLGQIFRHALNPVVHGVKGAGAKVGQRAAER